MTDCPMETLRCVVPDAYCDAMGHMNTRYYAALFDDAGTFYLGALGHFPRAGADHLGWADVRNTIEFKREVGVGALLVIETRVAEIGGKSMTLRHRMTTTPDGVERAVMETKIVCFDLAARRAHPVPDSFRNAVATTETARGAVKENEE